jgi:hypothetical protein
MRRLSNLALVAIAASATLACSDDLKVGRQCYVSGGGQGERGSTTINPTALECPTHMCLYTQESAAATDGGTGSGSLVSGYCSRECVNDNDCPKDDVGACNDVDPLKKGFRCVPATVVGPFCCKKFCMCKKIVDAIPIPAEPEACSDVPTNTCCNIAGRSCTDAGGGG